MFSMMFRFSGPSSVLQIIKLQCHSDSINTSCRSESSNFSLVEVDKEPGANLWYTLGRGVTQSKSSTTDEPEDIGYLMTNVKYFWILLRFFRRIFDLKFLDFCVVIIETSLAHTAQAGQLPVQNIDLLCQLLSHVPGLAGAELICTVSSRNAALWDHLGNLRKTLNWKKFGKISTECKNIWHLSLGNLYLPAHLC